MTRITSLKNCLFVFSLFVASTTLPASAYHSSGKDLGVGAVQCSYILAYQENAAAQKDVQMWVQKFVDQVNEEMSSKKAPKDKPKVALSPELQWFATLLYCGLDPNQPLVKATMRMIDAEWDKMQEQRKRPL
tara:strand:+ start:637 stop:1032 length:396 start_codon:yes stop_codon:yes gene_type:complete